MTELTNEQKLDIMREITTVKVNGTEDEKWHCSPDAWVKSEHFVTSICGSAETKLDAIYDAWEQMTKIKEDQCIIVGPSAIEVFRWSGFHWARVPRSTE